MIKYKIEEVYNDKLNDSDLKEIVNKKIYKIIELIEFNNSI